MTKNRKTIKTNNKNKRTKTSKKRGGGCGCGGQNSNIFSKMALTRGGGDFFNAGMKESPSFTGVPISKFYPSPQIEGHNFQGGISSRLIPQQSTTPYLLGGKKNKKRKNKSMIKTKGKKIKKGGMSIFNSPNIINTFSDPLINKNMFSLSGNAGGSLLSSNIITGKSIDNLGSMIDSHRNQNPMV